MYTSTLTANEPPTKVNTRTRATRPAALRLAAGDCCLRHDRPMPEQRTSSAAHSRLPVDGYPLPLRLPDRDLVLWWGPDKRGTDVVAVEGGHPLASATLQACLTEARARGLARSSDEKDAEAEVMDLRPVATWLRGEQLSLDPVAALNLWNLAGDIAASVDVPRGDEGRS